MNTSSNDNFIDKLISVNRVCKTVKGGRIFSFTALTVVGNTQGSIGYGYGKGKEIPLAITKSIKKAKKNIIKINIDEKNRTILHTIKSNSNATCIIMIPAKEGTGIIAGKTIRAILELAGIYNVVTKIHGSTNPMNIVKASIKGLANMVSIKDIEAKKNHK